MVCEQSSLLSGNPNQQNLSTWRHFKNYSDIAWGEQAEHQPLQRLANGPALLQRQLAVSCILLLSSLHLHLLVCVWGPVRGV